MGDIYIDYQGTLSVFSRMLIDCGLIKLHQYNNYVNRGKITIVRRGGNGRKSLAEFQTIRPSWLRQAIIDRWGDPYADHVDTLADFIKPDPRAAEFYSLHRKPDGGMLEMENQLKYRTTAEIYKAISAVMGKKQRFIEARGGRFKSGSFYQGIAQSVKALPEEYHPNDISGKHWRTIKRNHCDFMEYGYPTLLHGNEGNANRAKRNTKIDRLILSLYARKENPYVNTVHEDYIRFVTGQHDLVNTETGEIYSPKEFQDEKGNPVELSVGTIWNIVNDHLNVPAVMKKRMGQLDYNSHVRPYHERSKSKFSLSKISMDDRDLPRKMHNGQRVKAYYAYDVKSGAIIGQSYSKHKTADLFIDCMRSTLQNIDMMGYGIPGEVEVEHHLVNLFKDDLMAAGTVFPIVRWANPGNAQEKWAETGNRLKKYGFEKRYQEGIGRFYAKLQANRTYQDKVFDADNNTYKEKTFDYTEIVADDLELVHLYNNTPLERGPYKGMTRIEVLKENANPNLARQDKAVLARYIGEKRQTSIRRNAWVKCNYTMYLLDDMKGILGRLNPGKTEVTAYWLPYEAETIYLYQGDKYIGMANDVPKYNESRFEWDAKDEAGYETQAKYLSQYDAFEKEQRRQISKVEVLKKDFDWKAETVEIVKPKPKAKEVDDFDLSGYDPSYYEEMARENL